MRETTDDDLYRRYRKGNAAAFDELYTRYNRLLFNYVKKSIAAERVEEVYQDVWLKVIASAPRYQDNGRFRQWIFTCAHHLIVDEYRRADRGENVPLTEIPGDEKQGDTELKDHIERALTELPLEQRQAFYLRHELDCSVAEIAAVQGCQAEAAKSRLRYAYSRLRKLIEETTS